MAELDQKRVDAAAQAVYDADNGMDGDTFAEVIGEYGGLFDVEPLDEYRARILAVCRRAAVVAIAAYLDGADG